MTLPVSPVTSPESPSYAPLSRKRTVRCAADMESDLHRAMVGDVVGAPGLLRPLPDEVVAVLVKVDAPARLGAHLRAVHDVAYQLVAAFRCSWPRLSLDGDAVTFGAATHDVGKSVHRRELTGTGNEHEEEGYRLLLASGVPDRFARFARTHARWEDANATNEDLLVALADKVWKGKREERLEQFLVQRMAVATSEEPWSLFMWLDDLLGRVAAQADERLEFQGAFRVDPE